MYTCMSKKKLINKRYNKTFIGCVLGLNAFCCHFYFFSILFFSSRGIIEKTTTIWFLGPIKCMLPSNQVNKYILNMFTLISTYIAALYPQIARVRRPHWSRDLYILTIYYYVPGRNKQLNILTLPPSQVCLPTLIHH